MSEILEKLKAGKSFIKTVYLDEVAIGMRLLSENDYFEAGLAVIDLFKSKGIDDVNMANAELFELEKSNQLLLRALVNPATGEPLVNSPLAMRKSMSRAHKSFLISEYLEFEKEYSPMAGHNISDSEFAELFDTLKKTPETVNLNDLNSGTLRRLITALVFPQTN
ncbi:hypothetical protein [Methylomonas koyamae]|uniref:Uncharacterized protein n=1 Tax=Methylomonas koyamae TaxID=702114 RepID=A0A291IFX7_9GAMM|nr:hypothetical protein [Methylomonas koyamae]ATG89116.1 hypothetical protein MKLM6_0844 [Methylomonas koyamae]OAI24571.1 hypothetical protein A1356_15540 [Methylomonas koyamae]